MLPVSSQYGTSISSSLLYPGEFHEHLMATKVISPCQNLGIEKYADSCAKESKGIIIAFCAQEKKHLCKKGYVDFDRLIPETCFKGDSLPWQNPQRSGDLLKNDDVKKKEGVLVCCLAH